MKRQFLSSMWILGLSLAFSLAWRGQLAAQEDNPFDAPAKPDAKAPADGKPAPRPMVEIDPFAPENGKPAKPPAKAPSTPSTPTERPAPKTDLDNPFGESPPPKPRESKPAPPEPPARDTPQTKSSDTKSPDTKPADARPSRDPDKSPSDSNLDKAKDLIAAGKNEQALRELAEALCANPADSDAYYYRGGVAERNLEHFDAAIEAFGEALRLDPDNGDAYLRRGIAWFYKGEYNIANHDFDEAQRANFEDFRPHLWRGLALARQADQGAAIAEYTQCIRIIEAPEFSGAARQSNWMALAYTNRGLAYGQMGQPAKAVADFDRAIRINPRNAKAWCKRGVAQQELRQNDAAITSYNEAIRLDPKYALAYFNRSLARRALGNTAQAAKDRQQAVALDPDLGKTASR